VIELLELIEILSILLASSSEVNCFPFKSKEIIYESFFIELRIKLPSFSFIIEISFSLALLGIFSSGSSIIFKLQYL
jgi:hypothetical protein